MFSREVKGFALGVAAVIAIQSFVRWCCQSEEKLVIPEDIASETGQKQAAESFVQLFARKPSTVNAMALALTVWLAKDMGWRDAKVELVNGARVNLGVFPSTKLGSVVAPFCFCKEDSEYYILLNKQFRRGEYMLEPPAGFFQPRAPGDAAMHHILKSMSIANKEKASLPGAFESWSHEPKVEGLTSPVPDTSLKGCGLREVLEETGVDLAKEGFQVDPSEFVVLNQGQFYFGFFSAFKQVASIADLPTPKPMDTEEVISAQWYRVKDLKINIFSDGHVKICHTETGLPVKEDPVIAKWLVSLIEQLKPEGFTLSRLREKESYDPRFVVTTLFQAGVKGRETIPEEELGAGFYRLKPAF